MKQIIVFVFLLQTFLSGFCQKINIAQPDKNLTFTGTQIAGQSQQYDSTGQLILSGYIDTYYAYYSTNTPFNTFVDLPTVSPINNVFGLNLLQFGGRYTSNTYRGNFIIQWGDIPKSAWSAKYNFIQEANVGVKILNKLWFDAGFFRTHIGLESIQPRENIASSIATTTYFEPYFLSGAKLTYEFNDKFLLQANIFNGFNTFVETNSNKAVGLSAVITPNDKINITINTITCDESPDSFPQRQQRLYNNLYISYQSDKFDIGAEYNFGMQQNTKLSDSTKTAYMQSALLAIKYKHTKKLAFYIREEYFSDPNEILTGPLQNSHHQLIGLDIFGSTAGIELKPIPNAYIRLESRLLHSQNNEDIFYVGNNYSTQRIEAMINMGVWF